MKGIMFKEDLFKAVIEGRKTQTRRIIPKLKDCSKGHMEYTGADWKAEGMNLIFDQGYAYCGFCGNGDGVHKPRYNKGETIYLKEPYFISETGIGDVIYYKYPPQTQEWKAFDKWKNKMFMAEKYARYFIKIVNVRVERLQDISTRDAHSEGVYFAKSSIGNCYLDYISGGCNILTTSILSFKSLWRKINGKDSWSDNPWVWVYEFELTQ